MGKNSCPYLRNRVQTRDNLLAINVLMTSRSLIRDINLMDNYNPCCDKDRKTPDFPQKNQLYEDKTVCIITIMNYPLLSYEHDLN
jgi:hypothetical protein